MNKAEIGSELKAARLKKGASLEIVSQQTRIPRKFLEALEGNRFDELPGPAYLRGFLKNYCDYLDLDFESLWNRLQHPEQAPAPAQASPAPQQRHFEKSEINSIEALLALICAGALTLAIILLLAHSKKEALTLALPAPPALLKPLHEPIAARALIEFRSQSWVSIALDGRLVFEGNVPRNARQQWIAKNSIALRTPSPAALKLTLNGVPASLGKPNEAGEYRIAPLD